MPSGVRGDLATFVPRWIFSKIVLSRVERLDEIGVAPGAGRRQLDDRDRCSERRVDGPHLQADVAAADDEQRFRDRFELEGRGRIHDASSPMSTRERPGSSRSR